MRISKGLWWKTAAGAAAMLLAAQLVPYGYNHLNPPIVQEPSWDAPATRVLAKRACFDCHSNETRWPAYARLAPVSWLIQHDIDEGRGVLNFSEWNRPQEEAGEAREAVLEREMPPAMYALAHSDARLTDTEREQLARGLMNTLGTTRGDRGDD